MTDRAADMRAWRRTDRGRQAMRAHSNAASEAVKWVIAEHPNVWREILRAARVDAGLPPDGVSGRPVKQ